MSSLLLSFTLKEVGDTKRKNKKALLDNGYQTKGKVLDYWTDRKRGDGISSPIKNWKLITVTTAKK